MTDTVRIGDSGFANGRTWLVALAIETIATLTPRKTSAEAASGAAGPLKRGTTSHNAAIHSTVITIIGRL